MWSLSAFSLAALSLSGVVLFCNFSGSAGSTGAVGGRRSSEEGGSAMAVAVAAYSFSVPFGGSTASALLAFLGFFVGLGISQIRQTRFLNFCSRRDRHKADSPAWL